ncbi:MAG: hypothetical protein QOG05_2249 [Streptosporangiaceae bacterium]|nr:hypothetical protein [Streptosporangiaceae bacterium]
MPVNETEVLLQAPAWAAAAAGDLSAGRRKLEAAADLGEEIGDLIGAVGALYGLARLGHARRVSARLTALAAQVDGDLAAARAAHASALAARDSEALAKVAGQFEELGAILCAAEASAEAAVLLRHAGEARRAAAAEQRAARLLARCEGGATPPVRLITARVRLTQGELDTAMQAAAGRSNKQIAADMQLSVQTVKATCSGPTRSSASPAPTSWPARCGTSPPPDPPGRSVVPPRNPVAATDARPPPPWPTGAVHAA